MKAIYSQTRERRVVLRANGLFVAQQVDHRNPDARISKAQCNANDLAKRPDRVNDWRYNQGWRDLYRPTDLNTAILQASRVNDVVVAGGHHVQLG